MAKQLQGDLFEIDPAPHPLLTHDFLSPSEERELFDVCSKLEYVRNETKWGLQKRHSCIVFMPLVRNCRAQRLGLARDIETAPSEIKWLGRKLSEFTHKNVNYLSVVCYEDGGDYMDFHQHKEDKAAGRDQTVWIVTTGAERPFAIRECATGAVEKFIATAGSLITLPSSYNHTHEHAVPKYPRCKTVRYAVNCKCI